MAMFVMGILTPTLKVSGPFYWSSGVHAVWALQRAGALQWAWTLKGVYNLQRVLKLLRAKLGTPDSEIILRKRSYVIIQSS